MDFFKFVPVTYTNKSRADMYERIGMCVGDSYKVDTDTYIDVIFFGDNSSKVVNVKNISVRQK